MRLTAIIIFLAIVQVSASSFGQKVTYLKKDVTLVKLFKEIKKQTGFNVVWYEETLDATKIVGARFKDASVEEVMSKALNGMQLTYTISKNSVVIKEKERSFLEKISEAIHSFVKDIHVRGKITDEYNKPLKGATVKIKGTNKSVITDEDGNFYFENVKEKSVLVISFLGFKTIEKDASENLGGIQLEEGFSELAEVQINAGYYTVTDRERTGNITKITSSTIEKQPVNNPLLALQGRVPGLVITQQTGIPGGGVAVQIRGRSSISTQVGNDPLYIVDGVSYPSTNVATGSSQVMLGSAGASPLSYLSPNDIESIEVLKDADATAIYGSRGANGVILIKTKRGVRGKTKINVGITQGFNRVGHKVKLLNTEEYLKMRLEAFKNDGLNPTSTDYDVNGTWDKTKYTDWQKELIGGTAHTTNASLNASGGTESVNYLIGGNYYQEGTVFPGNFSFRRGGMHSSITFGSIKDRFNASLTTSYSHTQSNLMANDVTQYITLAPNAPNVYDQYGKLNWDNNTVYINPLATLTSTNITGLDNLIGNLTMSYRLLDKLILKTSLSYGAIKSDGIRKFPLSSFSPAYSLTAESRESYFSNVKNNNWTAEPQLSYTSKLGPGNFDALIGMSFQGNSSQLRTILGNGFSSDRLMDDIFSAGALYPFENTSVQYRYVAAFTRLNYNLKNKYLLNLTARRDGSSRFGDGKKFANFGAVGLGWIFSEETFLKDYLPFLSLGKLRASYGVTGNDQISDYGYLQLWTSNSGTYQGIPTIAPTSGKIGNPDFAWETNRKAEIAMQLGFWEDRINLEFSFYRNRTSNQLIGDPLPPSTGNFSIQSNRPATVQNSGLEIEGSIKLLNRQNLKWSLGFNLTIPRNKLISYPGIENSPDAFNYLVGEPLTIRRIYNVKGVSNQTGLYDIEDKDGNGLINDSDRYLYKFIGQYFYGAISNTIHFKQFTLDFLISFTKQNGNNYLNSTFFAPGGSYSDTPLGNQPTIVLERWNQVNDQSSIQKFSTLNSSRVLWNSARGLGGLSISDASYIRLKNISFSYALPTRWLSAMKISKAEINLQGQNVFTLTNYVGLDPETQSLAVLPPLRALTLGLNLIF